MASVLLMAAGDPARGYDVVRRQTSTCTLCHAGPFPNPHLQGTIGPDLHGIGARLDPDTIRARLIDPTRFNPDTIMPAFGTIRPGLRTPPTLASKPLLTPDELEDAVAYLSTLK